MATNFINLGLVSPIRMVGVGLPLIWLLGASIDMVQVQQLLTSILLSLSVLGLASCGGSSSSTTDTEPDNLSYMNVSDARLSLMIDSNAYTVTGVTEAVAISVSGGEYSVNDGAFTDQTGMVDKDDSVKIRLTSADTFGQNTSATVNIGDASTTFVVTTQSFGGFVIEEDDDAAPGATSTSASVAVDGFEGTAPISVTGGSYSLGTADFTSTEGTIAGGESIRVQGLASPLPATNSLVTITIGGVAAVYSISTMDDTQAPQVEVVFPPENSMTEGSSILVRGKATDLSAIENITINTSGGASIAATSDDGFATWQAEVPLVAGNNTLTISAADSLDNTDSAASEVRLLLDSELDFYPNDLVEIGIVEDIALDETRNRLLVTGNQLDSIFSIDLATGARAILSDSTTPNSEEAPLDRPEAILVDDDIAWVLNRSGDSLYSVDLTNGERDLVSNNVFPSDSNPFVLPRDMVFLDEDYETLLINNDDNFIEVDLVSGERTLSAINTDFSPFIFRMLAYDAISERFFVSEKSSGNNATDGIYIVDFSQQEITPFSTNTTHPEDIQFVNSNKKFAIDPVSNSIFAQDWGDPQLIKIDLETGAREQYADETSINVLGQPDGIFSLPSKEYILISNFVVNPDNNIELFESLHALDVVTGHRVIISKWKGFND